MKEEIMTDALLREFLLGNLDDETRARVENLFLTDDEMKERVLAVEQDLIEEYLENSLTEEDKERFLARYAQTDEQRRQLRITRSIKEWAVRETRAPHPPATNVSVWTRVWTKLRLRTRFAVPITVVIVIAIVLGIVWLKAEKRRKHRAVEQELVQLNSPASLREVLPETSLLDLMPVSARSVEPQDEIKVGPQTRFVEVHLPWIRSEHYSAYQAEIERMGDDDESFTIPNLQPESNAQQTIRLRLPVNRLRRGQYKINLAGIAAGGATSSSEEYTFVVPN